jgi:ribonuclease P/MRP protein subunit POP1
MADNTKKRKLKSDRTPPTKRARFQKPQYNITTKSTTSAYPNGEISVSRFMRAHENEVRSLENAMKAAHKVQAGRAFQDVPRDMRRRTGSHNPQRVPKRLRVKARKEAKDDNTPISRNKSGSGIGKDKVKWLRKEGIEGAKKKRDARRKKDEYEVTITTSDAGEKMETGRKKRAEGKEVLQVKRGTKLAKEQATLAKPATPPSRFRRRQVHKTWLPTHIWHAKRAFLTPPKEPLWRFAIPLAPVVKAYRLTHRAATLRGAVAWDTSYMATIGLDGVEASIIGLLKGLRFAQEDSEGPWQERGKGKKWRLGTRMWEGWIHEREGAWPKKIAPVAVVWCVRDEAQGQKRKAFIRAHPGAFLQLWNEIVRIAKVQKPEVIVEDLRFEIGSIEILGPAAAETLCSILSPGQATDLAPNSPQSIWSTLTSVTDTGVMPLNAVMAFPVSDPRLQDPPKTATISHDSSAQMILLETLAQWPIDETQTAPAIFDRNTRLAAGRALPSQKSINRRKSVAPPGQYPDARSTDPQIPMLTYVSMRSKSWTVLLPWKCIMPVWRCMMRYPVSSSGNPRFGGLKERRQVDFERSEPQFPFDCPGTDAGWVWELQEREARKHEWTKRPKGKRIEWTSINLGNGKTGELGDPWACAWERLLSEPAQEIDKTKKESEPDASPFRQLLSRRATEVIAGRSPLADDVALPHLFAAKISMVQRGVPTTCARIYRLPANDAELRAKWLSLMPGSEPSAPKRTSKRQSITGSNRVDHTKHARLRAVASSLLDPPTEVDGQASASDEDHLPVPGEEDLIGFVTTGNYNLAEGMPTAIANIALHRVLSTGQPETRPKGLGKDGHVCIVREAGRTLGRLATWKVV